MADPPIDDAFKILFSISGLMDPFFFYHLTCTYYTNYSTNRYMVIGKASRYNS